MDYLKIEIDDSYINEMAEYFENQGKQLQDMVDSYIAIMKRVSDEGITKGQIHGTLILLMAYAENLKEVIFSTSTEISNSVKNYIEEIDTQDQYLY